MTKVLLAIGLSLPLIAAPQAAAQDTEQLSVDVADSYIYVVTHRSGLLGFLGHDHAILAREWNARLCWNAANPGEAHARFTVHTPSLVIDSDSARELARLGRGPGADDRAGLQRKLLDDRQLAAQQFPELRFASIGIQVKDERTIEVSGELTIRGISRAIAFLARIDSSDSPRILFAATIPVRQSDFGIRPESIAGVVKVRDRVEIHVFIAATPTGRTCAAGG